MPGIKIGRSKAQLPLRVEVEKILVPDGFTQTLNDHLLLVYTGKTRLARNLLQVTPGCCTLWLLLPPLEHSGACPFAGAALCHLKESCGTEGCGCGTASLAAAGARRVVTGHRRFWPMAGCGEKLVRQAALHRAER